MKVTSYKYYSNFFLVVLLFIGNFFFQSWAIGKQVRPDTDEGVYLYQAKLVTQGYIPYRDFAMTSHVPFLTYVNALVLRVVNFDMLKYHDLYILWVFLSIFPLFYTINFFTRSKLASVFGVLLFSTFAELVLWDAHFFAIRQASLPFFAFFIYFFFVEKKETIAQVFLALFSFCLITNFFLSLLFLVSLFVYGYVHKKKFGMWVNLYVRRYWLFFFLTGFYFGVVLFIPKSMQNLLGVQQGYVPFFQRLQAIGGMMPANWPIFFFGAAGMVFFFGEFFLFPLLAVLTFIVCLLASGSFYTHYLVIIAIPFSIMGGVFFKKLVFDLSVDSKKQIGIFRRLILVCILFFGLYTVTFPELFRNVALDQTPEFFQIVSVLRKSPEPLFSFEPIYAIYAHKHLVKYYNTADMRVFRATGTNLSDAQYSAIVRRSNTVLLEPFSESMLSIDIKNEIYDQYYLLYANSMGEVYVRKR